MRKLLIGFVFLLILNHSFSQVRWHIMAVKEAPGFFRILVAGSIKEGCSLLASEAPYLVAGSAGVFPAAPIEYAVLPVLDSGKVKVFQHSVSFSQLIFCKPSPGILDLSIISQVAGKSFQDQQRFLVALNSW